MNRKEAEKEIDLIFEQDRIPQGLTRLINTTVWDHVAGKFSLMQFGVTRWDNLCCLGSIAYLGENRGENRKKNY